MKNITVFETERGGYIYYDHMKKSYIMVELLPKQTAGKLSINLNYEENKNQPIINKNGKKAFLRSIRNEDIFATWHIHPPFPEGDCTPSPEDENASSNEKRPGIVFQYNGEIWEESRTKWVIWLTDRDGRSFEYKIQ